jgi:phage protein D
MIHQGAKFEAKSPGAHVLLYPKKGKGNPRDLRDRLVGVVYTDSGRRRSTGVEITLRNDDDALFYDPDFRPGAVFGLSFGYPGLWADAGQFVMKEPKGRVGLYTVQAGERKRSRMARKKFSRLWENTTRAQAVLDVLRNHFSASRLYVEPSSPIVESITQTDEHDFQFCYRQAQMASYEFYIDARGARFERPKRNQRPAHELRYVKNMIGINFITGYSFDKMGAGIPGRVTLRGRDALTKKAYEVTVDKTSADDYIPLVRETSGADDPEEGDREEQGDIGYELVRNTGASSAAEALELANQIYKTNRYGAMQMTLEMIGNPTLRSRTVVLISGIGAAFDGLWWVKEVRHSIGSGGYTQSAQVTREGLAKRLRMRGKKQGFPSALGDQLEHIRRTPGGATHAHYNASQYGLR